jgi:carotenoid cleavage dioxygenase-like enzyme
MLGISPTGKLGRKFLDRLCRGDWEAGAVEEVYAPPEGCCLAGEPVYVAPPGEDGRSEAGVVIVPEMDLNQGTTRFLVVASSGVTARIELGRMIHTCFHAGWWAG